jgi:hypothetical protein
MQVPEPPDLSDIPLVLALWENPHYGGTRKLLVYDVPDLRPWNTNDKASSVGVHPGPTYQRWKDAHRGAEPTVTMYEDINFGGRAITLVHGAYAELGTFFQFDNKASSVRFNVPGTYVEPPAREVAEPIGPIRVVLQICVNANYGGATALIVEDVPNVAAYLGTEYRWSISSVRARRGPDYVSKSVGWMSIGGLAQVFDPLLDGGTGPGNYPDLSKFRVGWYGTQVNDDDDGFFVVQAPPAPLAPLPPSSPAKPTVNLRLNPSNGVLAMVGDTLTIAWTVTSTVPVTVSLSSTLIGFVTQKNLPASGSYLFQPHDNASVTLTATNESGSSSQTNFFQFAPGAGTGGGGGMVSTFYFKMTGPSTVTPCFAVSVSAVNVQVAKQLAETQYGGYTATQITEQQFVSGTACQ